MILHTVLPYSVIFPPDEEPAECIETGHGIISARGGKICSVFSTDPSDYLNPAILPGEPVPDIEKNQFK